MWAETVRVTAEYPDTVSWVAEQDGTVVAQAFIRRDSSRLGIFGMWVAPEARRQGIGRALLDAAESWGRSQGSTAEYLSVTERNSAAQHLYRRAGYIATGADEPLREGSALTCAELAKEL
jgi:ribosomal protein S18 acetylase RimI-like enzyme